MNYLPRPRAIVYQAVHSTEGVIVLAVALRPRAIFRQVVHSTSGLIVYSTDRSKAVVPELVLLFVTFWFILRGDLF